MLCGSAVAAVRPSSVHSVVSIYSDKAEHYGMWFAVFRHLVMTAGAIRVHGTSVYSHPN